MPAKSTATIANSGVATEAAAVPIQVSGGQRRLGLTITCAALLAGVVDLISNSHRLVHDVGFGWLQSALFFSAGIALVAGIVIAYVPPPYLSPIATLRAVGRPSMRLLFLVGIVVGLGVRLAMLRHVGTQDPISDLDWGHALSSGGLYSSYYGNYFPVSWQVFGSVVSLATELGVREIIVFKSVNVACDLLSFGLVLVLLRRFGRNPAWALLYWLMPYVVLLDILSYVDFQYGLFALLALTVVVFSDKPVDWLVAGIPLGVALLMKPEMLAVIAIVGLFATIRLLIARDAPQTWLAPALLFFAPALMFVVYSLYFWANSHTPGFLLSTYWSTSTDLTPSINAHGANIWALVALAYREGGEGVYSVTGPGAYHTIAKVLTLAVLAWFAFIVARSASRRSGGVNLLLLATAATLTVPMTMTMVHENHLFLGAVFAAVLVPVVHSARLGIAVVAFLGVAFLNLFALYGLDGRASASWHPLSASYSILLQVMVVIISSALFLWVLYELARVIGAGRGIANGASTRGLRGRSEQRPRLSGTRSGPRPVFPDPST